MLVLTVQVYKDVGDQHTSLRKLKKLFSRVDRDELPLAEQELMVETVFDENTGHIVPVQPGVSPQNLGAVWNAQLQEWVL